MKLLKLFLIGSFLAGSFFGIIGCDGKSQKQKYKHPSVRAGGMN